VVRIFFPQRTQRGEMIEGDPESQVEVLIERLRRSGVV
jgi:electron transfer flavoprotein alpha/beta subunit